MHAWGTNESLLDNVDKNMIQEIQDEAAISAEVTKSYMQT